ncbi:MULTISPECIES: hypothetical protein [unclassified Nonomuraea]|uniref:hypothetical protein n=1 Tax=unclassified Nonomuraea TaxID=2593643 RepID=UPI0013767C5A|nr:MULTISPECIES: hypothetical protein [unclassified Nonomuraea]NBE95266.1 hypothetical protein [Nonomuraea sp. K271]
MLTGIGAAVIAAGAVLVTTIASIGAIAALFIGPAAASTASRDFGNALRCRTRQHQG